MSYIYIYIYVYIYIYIYIYIYTYIYVFGESKDNKGDNKKKAPVSYRESARSLKLVKRLTHNISLLVFHWENVSNQMMGTETPIALLMLLHPCRSFLILSQAFY